MQIEDVFLVLNQKLDELTKQITEQRVSKEQLEGEFELLKEQSALIAEEWLQFEERLGRLIETVSKVECTSPHWKKGKALYDLLMFEQAIPYLEQSIQDDPEFEEGKLYLAYAYLINKKFDRARYYLQFLTETSENAQLRYLALLTLGSLAGMKSEHEQALYYYEKIEVDKLRLEWKATFIFNLALSLLAIKKYEEALDKLSEYYQLEPEDWQGAFMLGNAYLAIGDEEAGIAFWLEALQLQENVHLLKTMASYFEEKKYYLMASQCYERLLKTNIGINDVQSWFGLAWNYGLAAQKEKSAEIYIKALSLFPQHLQLQISYAWMLIFWNEKSKAERVISRLQINHPEHPLIQGLTYLYQGEYAQALQLLPV